MAHLNECPSPYGYCTSERFNTFVMDSTSTSNLGDGVTIVMRSVTPKEKEQPNGRLD